VAASFVFKNNFMDERIINFLQNQSVMTICYADDAGEPNCFPCFFAFNSSKAVLYFKSSPSSYHVVQLGTNPEISGSILPDKLNVMALKGVQFRATVLAPCHPLMHNASKYYYQRFPLALVIPGNIYAIQLNEIKMTDGAKGFGKKIIWRRNEVVDPAALKTSHAIH
jgi:uncharacterized protein